MTRLPRSRLRCTALLLLLASSCGRGLSRDPAKEAETTTGNTKETDTQKKDNNTDAEAGEAGTQSSDAGGDESSITDAGTLDRDSATQSHDATPCDCDDHDPCNGVETCNDNGGCIEGENPCPAPSDYCLVTCSVEEGKASCSPPVGRDEDNDDHRDLRCTQDPKADDCNDDSDQAHPGAPETCDGIDNDCNGLADLDDGYTVAGSFATVAEQGFIADVAGAQDNSVYGMTAKHGDGSIRFMSFNDQAELQSDAVLLAPNGWGQPAVAWGDDSFGVAWGDQRSGGDADLYFQRVDAAGERVGPEILVSDGEHNEGSPLIAHLSGGDWVIGYATQGSVGFTLHYRMVSQTGEVDDEVTISNDQKATDWSTRVLVGSDHFVIPWQQADSTGKVDSAFWTKRSFSGQILTDGSFLTDALSPTLSVEEVGYAVTYTDKTQSSVYFRRVNGSGADVCGPLKLESPEGVVQWESDLMPFYGGYLVVASILYSEDNLGRLLLWRVSSDCTQLGTPQILDKVTETGTWFAMPRILKAANDGFMIVHSHSVNDAVKRRLFGPLLCDAP